VTRLFRTVLTAIFLLVPGCASSGHKGDLLADESEPAEVTVQVISRNFNDVVVYLHVGAGRYRLGTATGNKTTEFQVPWSRFGDRSRVGLSAEQIGDDLRATVDLQQVNKGDLVVWALENGLGSSSIQVH
jgi:hypothetical protein